MTVHQRVRALDGSLPADGDVTHVYPLRDGLVARMDVEDDAPRTGERSVAP